MTGLYQRFQKHTRRGLYTSLGIVALGIAGCAPQTPTSTVTPTPEVRQVRETEIKYFDRWGEVDVVDSHDSPIAIISADLDRDGDLDLIVASRDGLRIYENRLPQKR